MKEVHFVHFLNFRPFFVIAAVAAHKFVISFSFGLELFESHTRIALHVIYMSAFASMSAFGILIGIAVSESLSESTQYIKATSALQRGIAKLMDAT